MVSNQKPYRVMHKFWLDITRDTEFWLDEQIAELKARRSFVTVLRDALRLMIDLRAGRLDVLFELFPWTRERLTSAASGGGDDLKSDIQRLEQLIMQNGTIPAPPPNYPTMKPTGAPRPLNVPAIAAPVFDDDDEADTLVFKKSESAGMDASTNFFNQIAGYVKPAEAH